MANGVSSEDLRTVLLKGPIFGRRVNSWFAISNFMVLRDDPECKGGVKDVVDMAILLECRQHIFMMWDMEIEA